MNEDFAKRLVEEAIRQFRMRDGLSQMVLDETKLTPQIAAADVNPASTHPLVRLEFNVHDYKVERENLKDQHYTAILRGLIINKAVERDAAEELDRRGVRETEWVKLNSRLRKKGFSTNWEYDILVYGSPAIRALLTGLENRGHSLSMLFCLNLQDEEKIGRKYKSRTPVLIAPGATEEEIRETIIPAERERLEHIGYTQYRTPKRHYDSVKNK